MYLTTNKYCTKSVTFSCNVLFVSRKQNNVAGAYVNKLGIYRDILLVFFFIS